VNLQRLHEHKRYWSHSDRDHILWYQARRRDEIVYVYRLRDHAGAVLYMGVTNSLFRRWSQHAEKHWWPRVVTAEARPYASDSDARAVERDLLWQIRSPFNRLILTPDPKRSPLDRLPSPIGLTQLWTTSNLPECWRNGR
jgi:hypothetical protein